MIDAVKERANKEAKKLLWPQTTSVVGLKFKSLPVGSKFWTSATGSCIWEKISKREVQIAVPSSEVGSTSAGYTRDLVGEPFEGGSVWVIWKPAKPIKGADRGLVLKLIKELDCS